MKDIASMRKIRRPSLAVSFGRAAEDGAGGGSGLAVTGVVSSSAVADFFLGDNRISLAGRRCAVGDRSLVATAS